MKISEGQAYSSAIHIDALKVEAFARLSGDTNPIHVDPVYAATTSFGSPIVPGMFMGALISGALATHLPGPGTIYLAQSLQFHRPVFVGGVVELELRVISVRSDKPIATIATHVRTKSGDALSGEAVVKFQVG